MAGGTTNRDTVRGRATTHFAPVERAAPGDLQDDVSILHESPFIDGLMQAAGGFLAVLNEQRQILAINDSFLRRLGIEDVKTVFGLRLGEALECVHAHEEPGGCGTGSFCATCGAVIAMMAALSSNTPQQRECVATIRRDGKDLDLFFVIHCSPIQLAKSRYLLLFLQDITVSQNRATLENMFFHDMENMIGALTLNTRLLSALPDEQDRQASQKRIAQIATTLAKEVEMQRVLLRDEAQAYGMDFTKVAIAEVIEDVREMATHHPSASGKQLHLQNSLGSTQIVTDVNLLRRVLTNMLINAFEATRPGHRVRLTVTDLAASVGFEVWNEIPIPESIALRVFQRNFSTKGGSGRGLGTYTMKLFGETYLGGKITFFTSPTAGTVFRFTLPKEQTAEVH
jgi:signal transduction histidine kinase